MTSQHWKMLEKSLYGHLGNEPQRRGVTVTEIAEFKLGEFALVNGMAGLATLTLQ